MKRAFKNISLTFSIIALVIISLVIISLVAVMGYMGINSINNNVHVIYQDAVLPTQEVTEINKAFMNIRVDTLRMLDLGYNVSIAGNIDIADKYLRGLIEEYLEGKNDQDREVMVLDVAYGKYDEYMDAWETVKQQLLNEEEVDSNLKFKMDTTSSMFYNNMNHIIYYSKEKVEVINSDSNTTYENIKNNLIMISGASLILLLLASIIIIGIFRTSIKEVIGIYETIATGDLQVPIDTQSKNEFGLMKKSLAKTIEDFAIIIKKSKENSANTAENAESLASISQQMTAAADEVSNAVQEVAQGSSGQTEELRNIKSIIENFSNELDNIVASVEVIHGNTKETDAMVTTGNAKLQDLTASTSNISESFTEVSNNVGLLNDKITEIREITELINAIAEQTNLLALNAAIEAARAGDAGRGFAVVADEIRKLAEESKRSSENINQLLANITLDRDKIVKSTKSGMGNLEKQTQVVFNTTESFEGILANIANMLPKIEDLTVSMDILNTSKDDIVSKVETVTSISEGNSSVAQQIAASSEEMNASVEEVASTAQMLNEMARNMETEMNKFQI